MHSIRSFVWRKGYKVARELLLTSLPGIDRTSGRQEG
jgi:hypothetical protein